MPRSTLGKLLIPKRKARTCETHLKHIESVHQSHYDVLFLGDSMLERWSTTGNDYWENDLKKFNIMNAGVGGDKVENLLWRIQPTDDVQSILDCVKVKKIVLMIGTNNIERDSPLEIYRAITHIIDVIFIHQIDCELIIYGVLPRIEVSPLKIAELNNMLREYVENHKTPKKILYRDITSQLDGDIYYDDNVHLSHEGYKIWLDDLLKILQ